MRGKVPDHMYYTSLYRITPAYAGKRHSFSGSYAGRRDHPRLCGEKEPSDRMLSMPTGSPPPMRGKGLIWKSVLHLRRITPAYAGKSRPWDFAATK